VLDRVVKYGLQRTSSWFETCAGIYFCLQVFIGGLDFPFSCSPVFSLGFRGLFEVLVFVFKFIVLLFFYIGVLKGCWPFKPP
jgi:NADH:ubiquinone oxidoreductase subunit H